MSIFLLMVAPLIAADGTNIGNVYDRCIVNAAVPQIWSATPETIADRSMGTCRYLEPKLREGLDRMWRTDRGGHVIPGTELSSTMTAQSWGRLLEAKRNWLIAAIPKLRVDLRK